ARVKVAGRGADENRVVVRDELLHRSRVRELDSAGGTDEGLVRAVRVQHRSVRLEQPLAVDLQPEPPLDLRGAHELEPGAALLERFAAALDPADVERAVRREELLAGLILELAPADEGLLRQPHELGVGVRDLEDARGAVTRAAIVSGREL